MSTATVTKTNGNSANGVSAVAAKASDAKHQPNGNSANGHTAHDAKSAHAALFPYPFEYSHNPGLPSAEAKKSHLFSPFKIRDLTLKNRIVVSPMCMYSSENGYFTDWHLVHLGSYAVGGAGLIIAEATAVAPEGRISPYDAGLWEDGQIETLKRIVDFIHAHHAAAGIQLAHAGRKASTSSIWINSGAPIAPTAPLGWQPLGPSPLPWDSKHTVPTEVTKQDIERIKSDFVAATKRAAAAGMDLIEIHGAHGYLISSFLSPTSNKRTDEYGGSFENRTRFLLELVDGVRGVWSGPLSVRLSCHEWVDDGWNPDDTVALAKLLKEHGVDIVDCSSGGNNSNQKIDAAPGFQVPFADRVRKEAEISTVAVGMITEPQHAEDILAQGRADLVALAREFLRDSRWPLHAAFALGVDVDWPAQYLYGKRKV